MLAVRALLGEPYPPQCPPKEGRRWLMMLSFIEWDGAWQRPQHLASHMAQRGWDVAYCCPVRAHNAPVQAARLLFRERSRASERLAVLRPLVLPGEGRFPWVRRLNGLVIFDCLQREMRRRGRVPEVLFSNTPFYAAPFTWLPARVRAFDVMDEVVRVPWAPSDAPRLERLVLGESDVITAGTQSVTRAKTEQHSEWIEAVRYIPCGVDAERFAPPEGKRSAGTPEDVASLPRPIIGFFGAVNERLDPDLLAALADRIPEASIVLVGPIYRRFGGLREAPNVHFTGLKPYAELPRYLAAFDCAIVPYRLDAGIEFVQPVKILEYLAGGKPVVSTAIPDVAALYSDTVRIARGGPEDFVRQVREALAEGSARRDEYMAVARRRSWEEMARDFEDLFVEALDRRRNAPRRVVHLIHGTHLGGAEELAANLCGALSPDRYQGRVICLAKGETVRSRLERRGAAWEIVEMRSKTDLAVVLRLIERLRAARVDVLHTHTSRTNLVARLASRLTALPVVSTVHTAVARDINDFGRSNRVNAWIERLTRGWSACFVSVSRRNARELVDRGMDPARVVHIPNGVGIDTRAAAPEETKRLAREAMGVDVREARVVGIVASLRPRKGAEYLLRAVAQLAGEFPSIHLLVVGSAEWVESVDYLQRLKNLAGDLGIAERVAFTGHRDDAADLLSLMEVYVLPSLYGEGLPLSILEAMAQGKPVVATATEGNDELVRDGETGFLVPPRDPAALAGAIATLLRDPAQARAMGERGRELVRSQFSLGRMTQRYEAVYDGTLGAIGTE